jgi:hypothetical protein
MIAPAAAPIAASRFVFFFTVVVRGADAVVPVEPLDPDDAEPEAPPELPPVEPVFEVDLLAVPPDGA